VAGLCAAEQQQHGHQDVNSVLSLIILWHHNTGGSWHRLLQKRWELQQ
jgi:hypothetical protein